MSRVCSQQFSAQGAQGLGHRDRRQRWQQRRAVALALAAGAVCGGVSQTAALATQYLYTPAGTSDQWSAGTNWSAVPVSGAGTQLTFVGNNATVVPDAQISTTNDDIAGNFQLNILDLQGTGPATTDSAVNITGNTLELVANGPTLPVVNLNANDGDRSLDYNVSNALTLTNNTTLTGNGTGGFTFGGAIDGAGSLTKSGTSTVVLSGTNTYAGGTAINGGTLRATQVAALPGYNAAGKVSVNNGGTLSLAAGGVGQWTAADVDTLRANATFAVGSALGLQVDTVFSYNSNIAGGLGVAKTGGGTLVLGGANTYTGGTTINGGTLSVGDAGNFGGPTSAINFTGGVLQVTGTTLQNLNGNTINAATFNGGFDINDAGNTFTFSQSISGTGGLSKIGPGTLVLTGTNTHTGITRLSGGTLSVTNGTQLGSGTLNLGNSANVVTLQLTGTAPTTIANATVLVDGNSVGTVTINAAGPVEFTGNVKSTEGNAVINIDSPGLTTFSGPMHTSDNASMRNMRFGGNGNVLISGVISNGTAGATTGGIGYTGTGKMTLTGNNTWAGTLFVTNGTTSITNGNQLGAARVQFGEAATTASPTLEITTPTAATISNNIAVRSGTATPGILSAAAPLDFTGTMSAMTGTALLLINNSSPTTFSGSVAISDGTSNRTLRLGGSGDVIVSGVVSNAVSTGIGSFGYFGAASVTLSNANTYTGTTTIASGTLAVGNDAALGTSTLSLGNNTAVATIRSDGGPHTITNAVTLSSSVANPGTIGGSQDLTLGGTFSNSNTDGYLAVNNSAATTLAGPVYLSNNTTNGRTLHATGTGNLLISGVVADANGAGLAGKLEQNGAGTLTLGNANTYTGGTAVTSGTLVLANADATAGGAINVSNGALARAQASLPKAVTVSTLTTNTSGKFDVTNNSMVIRGMTAPQVQALITSSYNGGHWDGPGGITSSTAAASTETSVGYASNASLNLTEFKGVTGLAANDVLVRYTYAGDANLDGKVDIGDLGLLAGAWQQSGKVWFDGDFTYDGAVNIGDLGLLAGNWQKGVGSGTLAMSFDQAMAQFSAFDGVAVPEPASFGLLALGGLALAGRHRRRNG
jgi:autotransporter-associated beta strand protein